MISLLAPSTSMRVVFEMLIKQRPLSVQGGDKKKISDWKDYVHKQAKKQWPYPSPLTDEAFSLTLVFLYKSDPIDVDNFVKPIQDGLNGVVYPDDRLITDLNSRRRLVTGTFDLDTLPKLLLTALINQKECVYVRVAAGPLPSSIL